ncbi:MAG: AAA family ATPase [Burkholderiales bacterium]
MTHKHTSENLAKGFQRVTPLPSTNLEQLWQSIVIEESLKDQLVSQAVFNFTVRPKVPRSVLPLHGVILLYGVPGTGKTSLARGLASKTAEFFPKQKFKLIEVNPHQLTSAMMGQSQKAVSELFSQSILEAAIGGPTIVLLDEVETLAVERTKLSLEANPIDAHRATDAVLVQLDSLADQNTNLLFVATSNFPQAVDSAFVSRCDFLAEIPLPDERACADIIAKCLAGLAESFPPVGKLASPANVAKLAAIFSGLDGRAIRKAISSSFTVRREVAASPELLSFDDLLKSAKRAQQAIKRRGHL